MITGMGILGILPKTEGQYRTGYDHILWIYGPIRSLVIYGPRLCVWSWTYRTIAIAIVLACVCVYFIGITKRVVSGNPVTLSSS